MCAMPLVDGDEVSELLTRILAAGVEKDAFLSQLAEQVHLPDAGYRREFYRAVNLTIFSLGCASICLPADCRGAVLGEAHDGSVLVGHPGIHRGQRLLQRSCC